MVYVKCKKCGNTWFSKSKARTIKCKCQAYGVKITEKEYLESQNETPPAQKRKPKETKLIDIELEEPEDEINLEDFGEMSQDLVSVTNEKGVTSQTTPNDSVLGAGMIIGLDITFALTKKDQLSDEEKLDIQERADTVAAKYQGLANLPYGEELKLTQSVGSTILKRWRK